MTTDIRTTSIQTSQIRVELPTHLQRLSRTPREITVAVAGPITQRAILDAVERDYPSLEGTIRDHTTRLRRPFIRFFACEEDLSHLPLDAELPAALATGKEPFLIIGAIAGG